MLISFRYPYRPIFLRSVPARGGSAIPAVRRSRRGTAGAAGPAKTGIGA